MSTWPEWDEAVAWARLDGPFAAGTTGALKPKGGPRVSFVIETLEPGVRVHGRLVDAGGPAAHPPPGRAGRWCDPRGHRGLHRRARSAWLWRRAIGRGVARSTPEGLARLVALVEAAEAGATEAADAGATDAADHR